LLVLIWFYSREDGKRRSSIPVLHGSLSRKTGGNAKIVITHLGSSASTGSQLSSLSNAVNTGLEFIHSVILETYIALLQETTTLSPDNGQGRWTSERCKIWKGEPSARNAAQRGDHSMLMDPQPKRPFAA